MFKYIEKCIFYYSIILFLYYYVHKVRLFFHVFRVFLNFFILDHFQEKLNAYKIFYAPLIMYKMIFYNSVHKVRLFVITEMSQIYILVRFSRSLITNIISASMPGVYGAQDDRYSRHLLEFSSKFLNNRSKYFAQRFLRTLITNIISSLTLGITGAQDGRYSRHILEFSSELLNNLSKYFTRGFSNFPTKWALRTF